MYIDIIRQIIMSLKKLLKSYKKRVLFTTPSHNQGEFIIPELERVLGKQFFRSDFSEIEGFDNLKNPKEAIKASMENTAKMYEMEHSFYLTNGSTQGILTLLLSFLKPNDLILVAKNCHRAVFDGVSLARAREVILEPAYDEQWGIYAPITAEQVEMAIRENPMVKAFVMSCPYYEGIVSDVEKIAEVCHDYKKFLIIDEAHGALSNFDRSISIPAGFLGADAVVQSLHKTCGAPNQCSIMHLPQKSLFDVEAVREVYNKLTTSSPSYPLLFAIEQTVEFLKSDKGKKKIYELISNIAELKRNCRAYPSIKFYDKVFDETKILVKIDGLTGYELSQKMFEKYHIEDELANDVSVLYLTGIGTTKAKLKKLEKALIKIADEIV